MQPIYNLIEQLIPENVEWSDFLSFLLPNWTNATIMLSRNIIATVEAILVLDRQLITI